MKAAVTSTQCASPQCIASGNAERTIIIYYQWGPAHILSIHCPYCRRKIDIKLSASKVWYVAPDTWLAS
jgi:hypothetical protein